MNARFVVVKVSVPVDSPLGATLAQMPVRMRAGFVRVMADLGRQQPGASIPATARGAGHPMVAADHPVAAAKPEPVEGITLRQAW